MRLFRRRETLNEQLLREAGLAEPTAAVPAPTPEPEPPDGPLLWRPDPLRTLPSTLMGDGSLRSVPRIEDAVVTVEAQLRGDAIQFVALPDRSLLVEQQEGDEELAVLADAVEAEVRAPYRARARRHEDGVRAVGAVELDVRSLAGLPGDEITVAPDGTTVDDAPHAPIPALATLGDVVHAERLDGDWWELQVSEL